MTVDRKEVSAAMNEDISAAIIRIVRERQRNAPEGRGVLPRTVQCFLDEYRAEQTLRRDMARLAEMGKLVRIGPAGSRRGYRVEREMSVKRVESADKIEVQYVGLAVRVDPPTPGKELQFVKWIGLPVRVTAPRAKLPPLRMTHEGEYCGTLQ